MRNRSFENDFDLHENETACRTHFHIKGFAHRLVLKQRHKRTRKWPISLYLYYLSYFNKFQLMYFKMFGHMNHMPKCT